MNSSINLNSDEHGDHKLFFYKFYLSKFISNQITQS